MPIRRIFLDWSQPALPAAAEHLAARAHGDAIDLARVIVVVPGARAGRRLVEILVDRADAAGLRLTPPRITTASDVPELLYTPQRPFADELTQKLAWAEALRSLPPAERAALLPHPPAASDSLRWLELGELLARLHRELAADGLSFEDVLRRGPKVAGFAEHSRWQALCAVQRAYHQRLDALELWDIQTARLVAIRQREIATDKELILVGAVDLNATLRQMLDQIADCVTALVHAPPSLADRFDEHGCLAVKQWLAAEIPLRDEQIERADGPAEQADAVARWLASLGGRFRGDEVVIGVPDPTLAPHLLRQLAQCGVRGRWLQGQRLADSAPFRLLTSLAEFAERQQFADLARLVRHPDVEHWLREQAGQEGEDWLTALDEYHQSVLPLRLDVRRLAHEQEDERNNTARVVWRLWGHLQRLLDSLGGGRSLPLPQWAQPLRQVLATIYGRRTIDREDAGGRYLEKSLRTIVEAIEALGRVPAALAPEATIGQAVHLALAPVAGEALPLLPDPEAIELLGWLELALDDAPALVVTSVNDGIIPKSQSADLFLPNELRRHLELDDNDRRYARDAYALSVLAASRQKLHLVVAHRDTQGNPLVPSRLLFAAEADVASRRAVRLFGPPPAGVGRRVLLAGLPRAPRQSALAPPRPMPLREPLEQISVTAFRTYLACPYRFYLRHVLCLRPLADDGQELDSGQFGELVHDVLEQFGRDDGMRTCDDAHSIYRFLDERLQKVACARYGTECCRPPVRMQVEQIRRRLKAFADLQAQRVADGWQIVHSEDVRQRLRVDFHVDGRPIALSGRIDRIDWHEATGTLLVLDYKTGDKGDSPQRVHRKRDGTWIDLQLPLYRHLLAALPLGAKAQSASVVQLGYVTLPRDVAATSVLVADWSESDLAEADEAARDVIRKVREEVFWPPVEPPPAYCEDLAPICHDRRLGSWRDAAEEGA
jgi:hypothetical protein